MIQRHRVWEQLVTCLSSNALIVKPKTTALMHCDIVLCLDIAPLNITYVHILLYCMHY